MDDQAQELLRGLIEGGLPPEQAGQARELLERDPQARRFLAEHEALWAALGEAFPEPQVHPREDFRRAVLEATGAVARPRAFPFGRVAAAAALALVALGLWWWLPRGTGIAPRDQQMVRYLHVLRSFDSLEHGAPALDLRYDLELLRAFDGELESEG